MNEQTIQLLNELQATMADRVDEGLSNRFKQEREQSGNRLGIMTSTKLNKWEKLIVLYLVECNITEFRSTDIYQAIDMPKITYNKYVKHSLMEKGLLTQVNKHTYRFINPTNIF